MAADVSHDPSLLREVARFASGLGLGSSSRSGSGFDDRDFRPSSRSEGAREEKQGDRGVERKRSRDVVGYNGKKETRDVSKRFRKSQGSDAKRSRARKEVLHDDWDRPPRVSVDAKAKRLAERVSGTWHLILEDLSSHKKTEKKTKSLPPTDPVVVQSRGIAEQALARVAATAAVSSKDADNNWLRAAQRSGTTADRVAAHALLVRSSVCGNLRSLDALGGMVTRGHPRVVGDAMDALAALYLTELLPERKLHYFHEQPLDKIDPNSEDDEIMLLLWYVEDAIKRKYGQFIIDLEEKAKHALQFVREKTVKTCFDLLLKKPEQEQLLLSILVNKFGDKERKVASKAGYLLSCLLFEHPMMKSVVFKEVRRFVFRPNLSDRAKYYSVIFLNQMVLSNKPSEGGGELAKELIDCYFALFTRVQVSLLEKRQRKKPKKIANAKKMKRNDVVKEEGRQKGGMDARMLGAILTGVNRAFPYVPKSEVDVLIEKHAPALFKMIHGESFNVSVQALILLFQLKSSQQNISDRFYRALYSVLLSPSLQNSSKSALFLSLLYKAMKVDTNTNRIVAFMKRLLQVSIALQPNFTCGCLMLISEVVKERKGLWSLIMEPEKKDQAGDAAEDLSDGRKPPGPCKRGGGRRKDDRERLADDSSGDEGSLEMTERVEIEQDHDSSALAYRKGLDVDGASLSKQASNAGSPTRLIEGGYDMRKREPQFSHAESTCFWELNCLAVHFHPSVAAMTRSLLSGALIVYDGNPLQELTLSVFLDRFIQKKPKTEKHNLKGSSLMQPEASGTKRLGVGSAEFASLTEGEVLPDEVFFHRYFAAKQQKSESNLAKTTSKRMKEAEESSGEDGSTLEKDVEEGLEDEGASRDTSSARALEESKSVTAPEVYDYAQLQHMMEGASDSGDSLLDEEADEDLSEISSSESEEEKGLLESETDEDDLEGSKPSGEAKFGSGAVFASAEDYEHLIGVENPDLVASTLTNSSRNKRKRSSASEGVRKQRTGRASKK